MKPFKLLILLATISVIACSCVTSREVSYLRDLKPNQSIPLNSKFEAVISPYDHLRIRVIGMGVEKELAEPFNPFGGSRSILLEVAKAKLIIKQPVIWWM